MIFSELLLQWYKQHGRDLPWRHTRDPYAIWISEVILQQTRIEQGMSYYYRFMESFPDVYTLAAASEEKVLRLWQGLGYYSRARNLHTAAKQVIEEYDGVLPCTSQALMKLKGVGPYTAAAVASITCNEAVPALDGNVIRILARYFAIEEVMETSQGKKVFRETAEQLMPRCCAGDFNQAMMDFGSLVCKPVSPICHECMFNQYCLAFKKDMTDQLPRRRLKKPPRKRYFHYFVIWYEPDSSNEPCFFLRQRQENDIWQNMYEFPVLEAHKELSAAELFAHQQVDNIVPGISLQHVGADPVTIKHQLTHQTIFARFFPVSISPRVASGLQELYGCATLSRLEGLAKPRLIDRYVNEYFFRTASGLFSYLREKNR